MVPWPTLLALACHPAEPARPGPAPEPTPPPTSAGPVELALDDVGERIDVAAAVPARVGDLDGDGRAEIGVTADGTTWILAPAKGLHPGLALGAFDAAISFPDVTGDGRADALAIAEDRVAVADDPLASSLATVTIRPFPPSATADPLRLATGDLDGDGIAELLAWESDRTAGLAAFAGPIVESLEPADAAFAFDRTGALLTSPGVLVGDLTGDGDGDLLLSADDSDQSWLIDGPTGPLGAVAEAAAWSEEGTPETLVAGDLDADGYLDLVSAEPVWFAGPFPACACFHAPTGGLAMGLVVPWPPAVAVAGDVDADGFDDVLLTLEVEREPAVVLIHGPLSSGTPDHATVLRVTEPILGLAAPGDVDADGRADVVVTLPSAGWLVPGGVF